jgi:hypothetical protein
LGKPAPFSPRKVNFTSRTQIKVVDERDPKNDTFNMTRTASDMGFKIKSAAKVSPKK